MKTQTKELPNVLGFIGSVMFFVVMFIILYSFNKHSLYSEAEFESKFVLADYIETESKEEKYVDTFDLKVTSKSLEYIDPYSNRTYVAESAAEITLVYEYENKSYKVISILEKPSSDSSINTDWYFWKVLSIVELN